MKLTRTGYRINQNGKTIKSIEKDAYQSDIYLGEYAKVDGGYYYFNRKQGTKYIYTL